MQPTPTAPSQPDPPTQQAALASLVGVLISRLFAGIKPSDAAAALPDIKAQVAAIIHRYSQVSALAATEHYLQAREAAGVAGRFRTTMAEAPPIEQVAKTLNWATAPLVAPPPDDPIKLAEQQIAAVVATQQRLTGSASRLVLQTGRETTLRNVKRDPHAHGWARQVESENPCAFCALLATRGAVYKNGSEASAGFQAHDHCECQPVPNFGDYELPEKVQEFRDLYYSLPHGGGIKAFRAAFEAKYDPQGRAAKADDAANTASPA